MLPISRTFHFSVDDVIDSLIEVTDRNMPLFEHPIFRMFKELHGRYGFSVDLYLFHRKEVNGRVRSLTEVRDLRAELEAAGDFIRFGPHALDYGSAPYNQTPGEAQAVMVSTYREIDRFAGNERRSREVRLHFYSEMYELADFFSENGAAVLFSTDRPVGSYRMPQMHANELLEKGTTTYERAKFVRTQFRLEFLAEEDLSESGLKSLYDNMREKYGYVVCYTHECEFARPEICKLLEMSTRITTKW